MARANMTTCYENLQAIQIAAENLHPLVDELETLRGMDTKRQIELACELLTIASKLSMAASERIEIAFELREEIDAEVKRSNERLGVRG